MGGSCKEPAPPLGGEALLLSKIYWKMLSKSVRTRKKKIKPRGIELKVTFAAYFGKPPLNLVGREGHAM